MRYLELGYGQGVAVNIAAASNNAEFWGADFNPAHAAHAQSLARASGAKAHFVDDSFAELLARGDLPAFDIIALHGVWSWVSDENRRAIVEIIRRRLKVGGAGYISYNTLPGWAMGMPLRHMMTLHAETVGSGVQGVVGRIDAAISFGTRLAEAVAVLIGGGRAHVARSEAEVAVTARRTQRLNDHLISRARSNDDITHLAGDRRGRASRPLRPDVPGRESHERQGTERQYTERLGPRGLGRPGQTGSVDHQERRGAGHPRGQSGRTEHPGHEFRP